MPTLRAAAAARTAAATALLALLAGIPTGLAAFVGWPLPDTLPGLEQVQVWLSGPLSDGAVIDILALLLWYLWAQFLRAVLVELHAAHTGTTPPRLPGAAGTQQLAAALVTALTMGVTVSTVATPAALGLAVPATPAPHTAAAATTLTAAKPLDAGVASAQPATRPLGPLTVVVGDTRYTYRVLPDDNLSKIANAWLGDADRWPEIWALNRHKNWPQVSGDTRFSDPDIIYPNWVLDLPVDARVPADARPLTPAQPAEPAPPTCTPPAEAATPAPTPPGRTPTPTTTPTTATPGPTAPTADDGLVAAPQTPPASAQPGPTPPASTSPDPTRSAPANQTPASRPPGVSLPGGSWVDLGLALAIAAAAALVWAYRRRRYTPRPPTPGLRLDDPDLAPMPPVVTQVRRGLRRHPGRQPAADKATAAGQPAADSPTADDEDTDRPVSTGEPVHDAAPAPVVPALGTPAGAVWPPAGLGLTGPGAEAAGRGFLAAALAAGGVEDPDARSQVVVPAATLATLLGAAAVTVADTPRLTVTAGLAEALEVLEEHTLHRTRLVYGHEVDNIAALRVADPFEEPLPPIVLIADTTAHHERARIAALLSQGQRLDIHGILLGAWPHGDTVVAAADGTTTPPHKQAARHGSHPADLRRLAVLTPAQTVDLLATLAESHTGMPQPPAPTETPPPPQAAPSSPALHTGRNDENVASTPPRSATVEETRVADPVIGDTAASDRPATAAEPGGQGTEDPAGDARQQGDRRDGNLDEPAEPNIAQPDGGTGRVEVAVLGPPRIINADPAEPLRQKALELLVYLAAHEGSASQEAILDDLLPDAPARKAPHRLHTYVYNLRRVLRSAAGDATYLEHPPKRYILNPAAIDLDLWRMRDALAQADAATNPADRIAALRRAVDCYHGPLAHGWDYEWLEPYRESMRQQALDAHLALADALTDQPHDALAVLEAAMRHDPYAEPLYQAAMQAHAHLGDLNAIRTLRRTLTKRLDEIDAEPSDETLTLADQLIVKLQHRPRRAGPRHGDGTAASPTE